MLSQSRVDAESWLGPITIEYAQKIKMVECENIVLNINIFNVEYHVIIEIVESSRVE